MIATGCIEVRKQGDVVREIKPGDFVGETSFLAKRPMPADVVITKPVRFLSWSVNELEDFMSEQPEFGAALQRIFGQCLVRKLNAA